MSQPAVGHNLYFLPKALGRMSKGGGEGGEGLRRGGRRTPKNIFKSKQTRGQGGEGERGTRKNIYKRKQRRRILNRRKKDTKEYIEKWTCALCGRWFVTCAGGRVSEGKSGAKYGSVSSDIDTGHVPPK